MFLLGQRYLLLLNLSLFSMKGHNHAQQQSKEEPTRVSFLPRLTHSFVLETPQLMSVISSRLDTPNVTSESGQNGDTAIMEHGVTLSNEIFNDVETANETGGEKLAYSDLENTQTGMAFQVALNGNSDQDSVPLYLGMLIPPE